MNPWIVILAAVLDLVLQHIPHEQAQAALDDAGKRRAKAVYDAVKAAKFPEE